MLKIGSLLKASITGALVALQPCKTLTLAGVLLYILHFIIVIITFYSVCYASVFLYVLVGNSTHELSPLGY